MDPVAFSVLGFKVHWYGLMWLAAAGQFYLVTRQLGTAIVAPAPIARVAENLLFACLLGSLLGGRMGYALFYGFERLVADPLWLLRIWQGGMSFHGGLLGVAAGIIYVARSQKIPLLRAGDLACLGAPLGLALGRLGNYINGELWGRPTEMPWGVVFAGADDLSRHPSQLYALLGEGVALFLLLLLLARRCYRPGLLVAAFLGGYGLIRFILEFWREPDAHLGLFDLAGLQLTMGQLLCVPMAVAGAWLLASLYRARR